MRRQRGVDAIDFLMNSQCHLDLFTKPEEKETL